MCRQGGCGYGFNVRADERGLTRGGNVLLSKHWTKQCATTGWIARGRARRRGSDRVIDLAHVGFAHTVAVHGELRQRGLDFLDIGGS